MNRVPVDLHMNLDDNGTFFFVEDFNENEDKIYIDRKGLLTSPLQSSFSWIDDEDIHNTLKIFNSLSDSNFVESLFVYLQLSM